MSIRIRKETPEDFRKVFSLIQLAFSDEVLSDHQEQFLVERLRNSQAFEPELSLVAELDQEIVGYILLTKIKIKNNQQKNTFLAMAPVAVLPHYQGKGIGSQLILTAHNRAKNLGYTAIVVLGHDKYYPKFGYQLAENFGITLPFEVPRENCMIIELVPNSLKGVYGEVEYAKEFYK